VGLHPSLNRIEIKKQHKLIEQQSQIGALTSLLQKENQAQEKSIMALQEEVRKLQRGEGSLEIKELKDKK